MVSTKSNKDTNKNTDRTEREIHRFETEPAYVRVGAGVTKNMGDYESFRVEVAITVPCYKEQVNETFEKTSNKVAKMLAAELENWGLEL